MHTEKGPNRPETQGEAPTLEDLTRWGLSWIDRTADQDIKLLPVVKRGRVQKATEALEQGDLRLALIIIEAESENLYYQYKVEMRSGGIAGQVNPLDNSPLTIQSYFFASLAVELNRRLVEEAPNEVRIRELGQIRDLVSTEDK